MRKQYLWMASLLTAIVFIVTGCILTGTVVVTAVLVPTSSGSSLTITDADVTDSEIEVDLDEDEDFEEYKDDIKNIDALGFYLDITNNNDTAVTFQIFLEADIDADWDQVSIQTVIDSASALVFTGLTIPANTQVIVEWEESSAYIGDMVVAKPILQSGEFSVYPLAIPRDDFNVTIDSLVAIITLTGGK